MALHTSVYSGNSIVRPEQNVMEGERYDGNSVGKNRLCFPRSGLGLVKNCHGFKTFLSFMISSKRVDH